MDLLLAPLWFFLPAGIANVTPIFAAKLPWLRKPDLPVDLGRSIGGTRLLGANKTWRGLVAGVAASAFVFWLQQLVAMNLPTLADAVNNLGTPTLLPYWLLGPLLGAGALLGDMAESFIKRRRKIQPGYPWFPYDQIDFILGAAILSLLVVRLPVAVYLAGFLLWTAVQTAAQYVGFWLGVKERPI